MPVGFQTVHLWLDDERDMPKNFNLHVRSSSLAIEVLQSGLTVVEVSLDHDLGDWGSGYDVAKWIEGEAYFGNMPRLSWHIHSANPVGCERMAMALRNADKYWKEREDSGFRGNYKEYEANNVGRDDK